MPPRKAATRSSSRGQTILSFKTPGKITKSQTPYSGIKKDVTSSVKKHEASSPQPPADAIDDTPTAPLEEETVQTELEPVAQTEEERIAASFDDSSIRDYYTEHILATRLVQPVHQEELPLDEKVLRHFDLSSQYGPCIGISRLARWKRAKGLGMEPPVEVLAVCLKMEKEVGGTGEKEREGVSGEVIGCGVDKKRDTRRSYLDDYLSTRTARE